MNDPNKRIDVNLSSVSQFTSQLLQFLVLIFIFFFCFQLLSLKAELLRKQQEVSKTNKQNASDPFKIFKPKRTSSSSSFSSLGNKKKLGESSKVTTQPLPETKPNHEESEMLAKSKRVLEAKAKLYDRMTANGGSLNSDDRCLVRFNQKKQDERTTMPIDSSSDSDSDDKHDLDKATEDDDDDKWTEYTDCLGRTRRCLKEDLEFFKKKDQDLTDVAKQRNTATNVDKPSPGWFVDTKPITSSDLPLFKLPSRDDDDTLSIISKSTKAEEQRQQWEQKEMENINRDKIHYQDVMFDEARTHGVGYYAFSIDETERLKQQQALERERDKTLDAQKQREQIRMNREKIIAERVFAAKNRQRARLGLPPLDKEEIANAEEMEKTKESKAERKQKKKEEKERLKKEELDRKREMDRQIHLRPWDHGKDGVPSRRQRHSDSDSEEWKYKPEKPEPMSQEQWNEMKRNERINEFAPPVEDDSKSFNRFTTIKPKVFKRRNAEPVENMFNEPIRNELNGNDFPVDNDNDDSSKRRRAEIAPPPTFDYYGPTSSGHRPKTQKIHNDISASIDAGLQFLRNQSDKNVGGTKQSWVANTNYDQA